MIVKDQKFNIKVAFLAELLESILSKSSHARLEMDDDAASACKLLFRSLKDWGF